MTKIEKEIIEEIFKDFNDLTIKEWIAKGIKAGRKQLAEEIEKRCKVCNQPTQCIVACCCNCNFPKEENLQKEA